MAENWQPWRAYAVLHPGAVHERGKIRRIRGGRQSRPVRCGAGGRMIYDYRITNQPAAARAEDSGLLHRRTRPPSVWIGDDWRRDRAR
jgi:hypothetical protein